MEKEMFCGKLHSYPTNDKQKELFDLIDKFKDAYVGNRGYNFQTNIQTDVDIRFHLAALARIVNADLK
jgi:hypothetical protein